MSRHRHTIRVLPDWFLERVRGIEPLSSAWKAVTLPLCYTRINNGMGGITFYPQRPSKYPIRSVEPRNRMVPCDPYLCLSTVIRPSPQLRVKLESLQTPIPCTTIQAPSG